MFKIYLLVSIPFIILNLYEWWSFRNMNSDLLAKLHLIKEKSIIYFYIVMVFISCFVIIVTGLLYPIYAIDKLIELKKRRVLRNESISN